MVAGYSSSHPRTPRSHRPASAARRPRSIAGSRARPRRSTAMGLFEVVLDGADRSKRAAARTAFWASGPGVLPARAGQRPAGREGLGGPALSYFGGCPVPGLRPMQHALAAQGGQGAAGLQPRHGAGGDQRLVEAMERFADSDQLERHRRRLETLGGAGEPADVAQAPSRGLGATERDHLRFQVERPDFADLGGKAERDATRAAGQIEHSAVSRDARRAQQLCQHRGRVGRAIAGHRPRRVPRRRRGAGCGRLGGVDTSIVTI